MHIYFSLYNTNIIYSYKYIRNVSYTNNAIAYIRGEVKKKIIGLSG